MLSMLIWVYAVMPFRPNDWYSVYGHSLNRSIWGSTPTRSVGPRFDSQLVTVGLWHLVASNSQRELKRRLKHCGWMSFLLERPFAMWQWHMWLFFGCWECNLMLKMIHGHIAYPNIPILFQTNPWIWRGFSGHRDHFWWWWDEFHLIFANLHMILWYFMTIQTIHDIVRSLRWLL